MRKIGAAPKDGLEKTIDGKGGFRVLSAAGIA